MTHRLLNSNWRLKVNAVLKLKFKETLQQAGIPYEEMKVFGAIRLNVHVTCKSATTARKWASLLYKVLGGKVSITETVWPAKKQKGTCLRPTMIKGYLIGAAA